MLQLFSILLYETKLEYSFCTVIIEMFGVHLSNKNKPNKNSIRERMPRMELVTAPELGGGGEQTCKPMRPKDESITDDSLRKILL